jgi:hypothetical protein
MRRETAPWKAPTGRSGGLEEGEAGNKRGPSVENAIATLAECKRCVVEIRGPKLKDILKGQRHQVDLFDQNGLFRKRVSGTEAAALVGAEGFVGIGNRKSIRFVVPEQTWVDFKTGNPQGTWVYSNTNASLETLGISTLLDAWRKAPKKKITQGGLVNPK